MCKASMCLFSCALVLGLLLAGAEAADPSLVAHYALDEGAGATAIDSSANGYDGTLLGSPRWVTGPEDAGVALAFDPADGCAGIECPTFDPTDGTGQFTFAIWALWDGTETYHHFFTKSDGWGQTTMMFQLELWGGSTSAAHFNRIGISYEPDSTPFYEMPKNEWTHLGFVYDGAGMVVYLNGVDSMGPQAVTIGSATSARTVIGVADNDDRVWTGALDDVHIYSRPLAEGEVVAVMEGKDAGLSADPQPATGATDVPCDVTLGWTAGEFAVTHDVYLGTVFDDVNNADRADPLGVLVSQDQADTTYDPPEPLEFGMTYYWRVDEVNGPPDHAIFKGEVWNFTVEPVGYPIANITATSNGTSAPTEGPENTINGSGLNEMGEHSTAAPDMWLCSAPDAEPLYIQYDFGRVYKLHEMCVWNYNVEFELVLGFGLKDVTVEYSQDGTNWDALGDVQLAQATAQSDYTANTAIDLTGVTAQYVKLTVNAAWSPIGQFGLSEVCFLSVPVQARQPQPASGATDVSVDTDLTWRAGREAVTHEVYLSTDEAAVVEGTALADTVSQSSYTPGDLGLGQTYYWKVNEVNEAATPSAWEGHLWSFATQQYVMIDDMESYDDENTIFDTWLDGFVNETGSTVGYFNAPFAERTIVNSGRQSMPLEYVNDAAPFYSEAEYDLGAMDLSANGADTLRLFVAGQADNAPAPLYLALEDNAGAVAVVTHPDATITTAPDWTEWLIPYSDLAGVNLSRVAIMYIGLGDRDNPTAGGTGTIFIDDVAYGHPAGQ